MKTLALALIWIVTFSVTNAQSTDLIGTWNIIEYTNTSDGNEVKMSEAELNEEGSVWGLSFDDEKNVTQTSNMRTGSIETQEGAWIKTDDELTLELEMDERTIKLVYKYELKDDILVLKRSNPTGTWKVASTFKKQ